jgi:acyl dehydratase
LKHRTFTVRDQLAFAELSGDYNPLHVDPVAARRLLFGAPVVHGIHSLLWALDAWSEGPGGPIEIRSLKCAFPKPIRVGEEVRLSLKSQDHSHVKLQLIVGEAVMTKIDLEFAPAEHRRVGPVEVRFPERREPRVLSAEELVARRGTLGLCLLAEATTKMFPNLAGHLPAGQLAVLLATTRLVGVECPGLHSIYSELSLAAGDSHEDGTLHYAVTDVDERFGLALLQVTAPGMTGVIKAFLRPRPPEQETFASLQARVERNEFAGQRALVIGGSRGLGEVVAKLLAAGGADVKITYHQGQLEARRIVDEITSHGGSADSVGCDVQSPAQDSLTASLNGWQPTHLYYFATPFIFSGVKGVFSPELFDKFCTYYVTGFLNIVNALRGTGVRRIFHPSSVAVDERTADLGEYAAAKTAAEALCTFLENNDKSLTVYRPRLSRMATDQTVSLFPVDNLDPVPIMLDHLRAFRNSGSG